MEKEKEKISVEMFCKLYKAQEKGNAKTFGDFIKKHIVVDYIPYITKLAICTNIINVTTRIKDGDHEILKIDNCGREFWFTMNLINLYTDIEIIFDGTKAFEQYDELCKLDAIDTLISAISENEVMDFTAILNMKLADFRDNEYSVPAMLYNLKQTVSLSEEVINGVVKAIQEENNQTE